MSKKVIYRDRLVWHDENNAIAIDRSGNFHDVCYEQDDDDEITEVRSNGLYLRRNEAIKLMEEHDAMAKSNVRLVEVNHKIKELTEERDKLVNTVNAGIDLNSGSTVTHYDDWIKVGCKQVGIKDCRKLLAMIKRIAPGKAKKK